MKKTLKERLINLLKNGEIEKFNRYRKFTKNKNVDLSYSNLSYSDLRYSNLSYSDLSYSDLSYSNLRGSNLSHSDLYNSDLSYSNLRGSNLSHSDLYNSNLRYSNLSGSNLRGSDLRGSDLDFAAITLSCSILKPKTCEKIRKQFMFHTLSLMKHAENLTDKEKEIFNFCKDYANEFHRTDVEKL